MADPKLVTARYLSALNDELGWGAVECEAGDVRFEHRGLLFWVSNHAPNDPEYLRVHTAFPLRSYLAESGTLDLDRPDDRIALERLAARVTRSTKGAKVGIDGEDNLVVSVEGLVAGLDCLPKVDYLASVLPRIVSMAGAGVNAFIEGVTLVGIEAATLARESVE